MLKEWLLVALGGAVGSMLRFGVSTALLSQTISKGFPFGTLAVNIIGSFSLGWLAIVKGSDRLPVLLLGIGLLGGFTTFSAFSWETVSLIRSGKMGMAGLNVAAQIVFGLGAAAAGAALASSRLPGTL